VYEDGEHALALELGIIKEAEIPFPSCSNSGFIVCRHKDISHKRHES
jgi:hypothetical protein